METLGPVNERSTAVYTATITDENGDALPAASLDSLTLTLRNAKGTAAVINDRNAVNALNANGVTVDEDGLLTWVMEPGDNAIVGRTSVGDPEIHVALFQWTWDSGSKAGRHEVAVRVVNLGRVPA